MEDGLVHLKKYRSKVPQQSVLILIVVEDGLVLENPDDWQDEGGS